MRIGKGRHLLTSSNEDNEEDVGEGNTTRPSDPWLAPINVSVERDLV